MKPKKDLPPSSIFNTYVGLALS